MPVNPRPPAKNVPPDARHAAYLRYIRLEMLATEYKLRALVPEAKPLWPLEQIEEASRKGAKALLERMPELRAAIERIDATWLNVEKR